MEDRYPKSVDKDEQPDFTCENIPDEIIQTAIRIAVTYEECQHCGERQFMNVTPGRNTTHDCIECGETLKVIG